MKTTQNVSLHKGPEVFGLQCHNPCDSINTIAQVINSARLHNLCQILWTMDRNAQYYTAYFNNLKKLIHSTAINKESFDISVEPIITDDNGRQEILKITVSYCKKSKTLID